MTPDKKCPLLPLYTNEMGREVPRDCIGERCQWWWKCAEPPAPRRAPPSDRTVVDALESLASLSQKSAHIRADAILCTVLAMLGYKEAVSAYEKIVNG